MIPQKVHRQDCSSLLLGKGTFCAKGRCTGPFFLLMTLLASLSLLFSSGCTSGCTSSSNEIPLNIIYMAQAGYQPQVIEALSQEFERSHPGVKVSVSFMKYDEQHEKIVTSAAAPTSTYDVIALDLIWTAEFAARKFVHPLEQRITPELRSDIAPVLWDAFTYQDHLWAMPFLANFQLFFYNRKYLAQAGYHSPPQTMEEWEDQMVRMKEKGVVEYPFTDSWNQKEGLVCEYVWFAGAYGGSIFDERGQPVFREGPGLQALETMVRWIKLGLVNPVALNSDEPMAKDTFISGSAAFTTNWTFQYALMKDPAVSKVVEDGVMGLIPVSRIRRQARTRTQASRMAQMAKPGGPSGQPAQKSGGLKEPAGTLAAPTASVSGFQGLAIMSNSAHPDLAWEYIRFLTSPKVQSQHLEEFPVWTSVQNNPESLRRDPVLALKSQQILGCFHRPKIPLYPEVSSILQKYIHLALQGKESPKDALEHAHQEILRLEEE